MCILMRKAPLPPKKRGGILKAQAITYLDVQQNVNRRRPPKQLTPTASLVTSDLEAASRAGQPAVGAAIAVTVVIVVVFNRTSSREVVLGWPEISPRAQLGLQRARPVSVHVVLVVVVIAIFESILSKVSQPTGGFGREHSLIASSFSCSRSRPRGLVAGMIRVLRRGREPAKASAQMLRRNGKFPAKRK